MKKILYIDMDGALVDYNAMAQRYSGEIDWLPGTFANMEPVDGAIEAFNTLAEHYDVYILSTAPWSNESAWSEKIGWVKNHLGHNARKRLILSHHKNLCAGDYLIDDRPNNGAEKFTGEWLHFGPGNKYPDWASVLEYLL